MQATLGPGATRRLLKRLRDMMAAAGTAQQRLDRIVKIIADDLIAEVCSVYVMRAGQVLELFATEGLNPDAVHKTRLRVGEGLVGEIAQTARTLALADAQSHPNFAYRPETGEEIFHSMLGVPILRGGRAMGVLAIQNRTFRDYAEEEVEALQTVAMVLAELVASGELVSPDEMLRTEDAGLVASERIDAQRLNEGIAIGTIVLHQPRVSILRMVADDPAAEKKRLREAAQGMRSDIERIFADSGLAAGDERWEILETYRMFAEDRGWLQRIADAIDTGLTAEAAVQKVQEDNRARLAQVSDPYIRERVADFDDLANRLVRHLTGDKTAAARTDLPDDMILVARNLGPAELLEYDRRKLKGVALEEGSTTAHVAIIAHALDLPMVGHAQGLLARVEAGDPAIVDAVGGQIILRPREDVRDTFAAALRARAERRAGYAALKDLPAVTRDGTPVSLNMNAGLVIDLEHLAESGADGIGLYRTEIPFMIRSTMPDVVEQTDLYRRILDRADGKPVVFRTLDIGGDKLLPYLDAAPQENPAMGVRAIRLTLDRPAILREQVRGLLRAAGGRRLDIMFPMVAEVAEFDAARDLLDIEIAREAKRGRVLPDPIRVGVMLEVPALYWQLPQLAKRVDFVSVGSNDLMQFMFAADRGNPDVSERYDPLSPGMLGFLRAIARECDGAEIPLTLCGDMAAHPLEAMALLGIGYRRLSMPFPAIGPIKAMVRALDLPPLAKYLEELCRLADRSVRKKLADFARDHNIPV
ncbi:MAG: phosphoenolpyruvate--protein phosphotransferase [Azospirillum sp.]|nr:phosphoenolpyruvate--protein phosphotransferase [Azospirillum sp.]